MRREELQAMIDAGNLGPQSTTLATMLAAAWDALSYYGEQTSYIHDATTNRSEVDIDAGALARDTLAVLEAAHR